MDQSAIPKRIVLASGNAVPYMEINAENLKEKNIVVYGASQSGKSYIANNILYVLQDIVCDIKIISGTALTDQSFQMYKYAPIYNVFDSINFDNFETWVAQNKKKAALIKQYNRQESLNKAMMVIGAVMEEHKSILYKYEKLETLYIQSSNLIHELTVKLQKSDIRVRNKEINHKDVLSHIDVGKYERVILKAYKNVFVKFLKVMHHNQKSHKKDGTPLIDLESFTEHPSDLGPIYWVKAHSRQLIVFNDVSTELQSSQTKQLSNLDKVFDKGRHTHFNVLMLIHNPQQLKCKTMRKKFTVAIFTESGSAFDYITSEVNGKDMKNRMKEAVNEILVADEGRKDEQKNYYKLIIINGSKIGFTKADPKMSPMQIGSKEQWQVSYGILEKTGKDEYDLLS